MAERVITDPAQADAAWLAAALRRAGALTAGDVAAVDADVTASSWSSSVRLRPHYSPDAHGALPPALFLKLCSGPEFGRSEYDYYTRDYLGCADAPLPRCYDAAYSDAPRAYHLLLDDLSATHAPGWDRPVTPAYGAALADALAALHACRWEPARWSAIGALPPDDQAIERYVTHVRQGLEPLLAIAGDALDDAGRATLAAVFARHPPLMRQRAADLRGICVVHGDVNPGNILAPTDDSGRIYLIDRQPFDWSLTVWLAVSDLAYLLCSFWPTATRREHEQELLRRYHTALLQRGVGGYSWEQLWLDYRLSAVQSLYVAVEWCVLPDDRERMRWLWTRQLQQALAAYADLCCADLLGGAAGASAS